MANFPDIIRRAIQNSLDGVHTAIPARVVAYLPATRTATVQPVVTGMPELTEVPVAWPAGGGYYLHLPLTTGDHVLVVFCESDFAPWRLSGLPEAPEMLRRHGLYAYAVPGACTELEPLATPAVLGGVILGSDEGAQVRVSGSTVEVGLVIAPALLHAAVAEQVDARWAALAASLAGQGSPVTGAQVAAAITAAVAGTPVASQTLKVAL